MSAATPSRSLFLDYILGIFGLLLCHLLLCELSLASYYYQVSVLIDRAGVASPGSRPRRSSFTSCALSFFDRLTSIYQFPISVVFSVSIRCELLYNLATVEVIEIDLSFSLASENVELVID